MLLQLHLNYYSMFLCCFFTRSDYFVWLCNYYYLIFSSLIFSLLVLICMLFLYILIIVAGMCMIVFIKTKVSVCLWVDHYYLCNSLFDFLLSLICTLSFITFIVAGMFFAVLQEVITWYDLEMIIIFYPFYWFDTLLASTLYIFSFKLLWHVCLLLF